MATNSGVIILVNILFILGTTALSANNSVEYEDRIVHGYLTNITDFPYQVSLEYNGGFTCGGSIISSQWVLTAGHCVNRRLASKFLVRAGSSYLNEGGETHTVELIKKHPFFITYFNFDFALMKVASNFSLGQPGISAIKVASTAPKDWSEVTTSGWGTLRVGKLAKSSKVLRAVQLYKYNRFLCNLIFYQFRVTWQAFCAGYRFKGPCHGDSGGPAASMINGEPQVVGVVSWGAGCSMYGFPGVFSNVASVYKWINRITGI